MKTVKPLMNKSFIAKLLVICMIVGMLPTVALAATKLDDGTYVYSIKLDAEAVHGTVTYSVDNDAEKPLTTTGYEVAPDAEVTVTLKADSGYTVGEGSTYTVNGDTQPFTFGATTATATFSAKGDITVHPVFTPVPTPPPVTTPSDNVTDVGETEAGSSKVEIDVNARVSGGTASATVNANHMSNAVNKAVSAAEKNDTAPVIDVVVDTKNASALKLTLSDSGLDKLAENPEAELNVISDVGTVNLDATAIEALAEQATGTFVLEILPHTLTADEQKVVGDAEVYEVKITSGTKVITDFGSGTLTIGLPHEAAEGETVQVYYFDGTDLFGRETKYNAEDKVAEFKTDHLSLYVIGTSDMSTALAAAPDVMTADWYAEAVKYVYDNKLMNGYPNDKGFGPKDTATRAMVVTTLYRLANEPEVTGENTFTDVEADQWYTDAVIWAKEVGVTTGYNDTLFGTDDLITREQMATMLYRFAEKVLGLNVSATAELDAYTDADEVSSWALDAVKWANAVGLMKGTSTTTLDAPANMTRAQLATFLMRFDKNFVK